MITCRELIEFLDRYVDGELPAREVADPRRGGPRRFQNLTPLFVGKHDGFSGRAQHHEARYRSLRVALDVVLKLFEIHVAVRVKGRRDGWKNTLK